MKFCMLINVKMPTIGISYLFAEKFSRLAMFSKKQFAIVSNLRLPGQISCLAELSMKKVV